MIQAIKNYCENLTKEFDRIPEERKELLRRITDFIVRKQKEGRPVNLTYICTHNSRRSHFGQVWAQVAANYYGVKDVCSFSGGTEATAVNGNVVNTFKNIGFEIHSGNGINPVHELKYSEHEKPIVCFSKVYDDKKNPPNDYAAIMVCGEAEQNCPFIPGVELRIATTYRDPKEFDNTPMQDAEYASRCRQIALETLYVFSLVKLK